MLTELQKMMNRGNKDSLIEGLASSSSVLRTNAIVETAKHGYKDEALLRLIRDLRNDNVGSFGDEYWRVWQFAVAALDVLGVEKYTGHDEGVKQLIDSKFDF